MPRLIGWPRLGCCIGAAGIVLAAAACSQGAASPAGSAGSPSRLNPASQPASTPVLVAPYRPPERALEQLWEVHGPGRREPQFPAVDPGGRIWLSATGTDQIWIFDRDGDYLKAWGESGLEAGQVRRGAGPDTVSIAFAPDGSFYVADTGNRRIQQFDAQRQFVRAWGGFGTAAGEFVAPITLFVGPNSNVYVYDDELLEVMVFTAAGVFLGSTPCGGPFLTIGADGTAIAPNQVSHVLNRCAPDGTVVPWIDLSAYGGFISGVVLDPEGRLLVAIRSNANLVLRFEDDGTLTDVWEARVEGVAIDPDGTRIYAASGAGQDDFVAYQLPQ